LERSDCEKWLNKWLSHYVSPGRDAEPATPARYPLHDARVTVDEVRGAPGSYVAKVAMSPRLGPDELRRQTDIVVPLPTGGSEAFYADLLLAAVDVPATAAVSLTSTAASQPVQLPQSSSAAGKRGPWNGLTALLAKFVGKG